MPDAIPRAGRSTAVVLGAAALLILAVIYAAIAALFVFLLSTSASTFARVGESGLDFHGSTILSIGETRLNSEFGLTGFVIFGLLCLLSAYGGLASIWRWPRWASVARAAGWATILLSVYGMWSFLAKGALGLWFAFPAFGIDLPVRVSLAVGVAGIFVLWAIRKPAVSNP